MGEKKRKEAAKVHTFIFEKKNYKFMLIGAAFNTANIYGIRVGTYTESYSALTDAVIDELKTKEWLVIQRKRTGKGMDEHVWLNQSKVSEIMQFYEMYAEVE